MRTLMIGIAVAVLLSTGPVGAEISVFQGSDGTSGTITDLGGGLGSYSDSHGNTGTIVDLGGGFQSYQFSSPQGRSQSGTITTFGSGSSEPAADLTPVPFFPRSLTTPPMPREQIAPLTPIKPITPISPGFGPTVTPGVGVFGSGRSR